MNDSLSLDKRPGSWPDKARTAVIAGFIYAMLLFGVGALLTGIGETWLEPLCGAATALALELTILLPAAWLMNWLVASCFGVIPGWPMGVIVAGTTAILLAIADIAVLMLIGPSVARTILNHGWMEARFVAQMLMAALPLVYPLPTRRD
jgi:hypothetical protein